MTFDPTKDITLLKDTVINQDFTLPTGVNLSSPDPPISDAEKNASFNQHNTVRSTWAMDNHKGRLVIFFRYGTSVSWDQNKKKWIVGWATFAFSGSEHQFVAMNQGTELLLLDHEMGHYFHLGHTHSGATELADADKQKYPDPDHNPADKEGRLEVLRAKVVEVIRNFVDDQNHPADTGLNALDADQLSDTPPDPGPQIFEYEFGAPCSPMGLAIEVPLKSGARTYVLDPDRDNVMSYFFRCSGNKHFSPQQIDRIRAAVENPNFPPGTESRHHLIEGS